MDYRLNFLKQYLVGHKTELDNEDQVLKKCCELAYSDMLTVGRFFLDKKEGLRNKVIETFLIELKKCNYSYSHGLIDKLTELFGNKKIEKQNQISEDAKLLKLQRQYNEQLIAFLKNEKESNNKAKCAIIKSQQSIEKKRREC